MADPMRIRAQAAGDKATVRVLMAHEMETGQRKDAAGKTIPAWFIQQVSAQLNGKMVMTAQWGASVAKNPFLQFNIKGAKAGKLSQAGLTVNGAAKEGADSSAVKKASTKSEDKMSATKK